LLNVYFGGWKEENIRSFIENGFDKPLEGSSKNAKNVWLGFLKNSSNIINTHYERKYLTNME